MTTELSLPLEPPIATIDLPGTHGGIGDRPEDFVVDEVPLSAFAGEGEHLYVRVQKRRMTTRDAVRAMADAAGVPANEIGTAGMKDKHAVTSQWLSLPARRAKPQAEWRLPESLSVLETSRHGNKLRTGHLSGNRFRIRITGVDADASRHATAIVERIRERGLPNFFGAQRFGRRGSGLGDAMAFLSGEAGRGPRRRVPPFERKLFASVAQAEVFNRYAIARLAEGLERPLAGEVVRLAGTGSLFVVEDPEAELPRWQTRDIVPTGPITGPKMRAPSARAAELEASACEGLGIDADVARALGRHGDGTRRDLMVWPEDLLVTEGDEPGCLIISMFLPSGSFATQVIRELTREPFFRDATE
jgi:tRNA pseudouridine13 synthase